MSHPDWKLKHPNFRGNWDDLQQFMLLADSPMRSSLRETALQSWEQYRVERQFAPLRLAGRMKKGAHMRALTTRVIDLTGAKLDGITVGYADLRGVVFDHCLLRDAWLKGARLENASLQHADFSALPDSGRGGGRLLYSDLRRANFTSANLTGVDLSFTQLNGADLTDAILTDANLESASLIGTTIQGVHLKRTRVYGISAWDVKGKAAEQLDLVITPELQPPVTVDNLKVAQFIYLLMNNPEIRDVLDTITAKVVLILGRFTDERRRVLDDIKQCLRRHDFLPIIFDFDEPKHRDLQETVSTLAHMARFIVADITDPRSIPQELISIVRQLPSVPVRPLILKGQSPWAMFQAIQRYPWVLPLFEYEDSAHLTGAIESEILRPVEEYLEKQG